jgi:hypothetical protein
MFFLFLKETPHFYIKKLFSYQFICSKNVVGCGVSWQKFGEACWHTDFSRDAEMQVFKI